jgi:hypothetical protein
MNENRRAQPETMAEAAAQLRDALNELRGLLARELHLYKLLTWLCKRLDRRKP